MKRLLALLVLLSTSAHAETQYLHIWCEEAQSRKVVFRMWKAVSWRLPVGGKRGIVVVWQDGSSRFVEGVCFTERVR
jgi:hypothetical protein